jgi:RNA polymerase sigma factor (sigma-70 family)
VDDASDKPNTVDDADDRHGEGQHSAHSTQHSALNSVVDHLIRHQAGQVVATLTRIFGFQHLELAEDVVQDSIIKAMRYWSYHGIPDNPAGWIMQVAKNQALDILRRERTLRGKQEELARLPDYRSDAVADVALLDNELYDDQLRMMFTCCHPAVSREARVALTLKTLGGFGVSEIARAFLQPETTIAQRLVRAKRTLRAMNVPFAVPEADELPVRLDSVLDVLYLMFNEGYSAYQGEDLVRHDLCAEAIRLTALLARHRAGDLPKVHALLALMLLQAARLDTRTDAAGNLLLLEEQERSRWDQQMIRAGLGELVQSARGEELSQYHIEAGIAATHAVAPSYAATDWQCVLAQYDLLMQMTGSPVVALNRAVALAMVEGPQAGLHELARVRQMAGMEGYYLLHATLAEFWRQVGEIEKARASYQRALALTASEPARRFLQRRLDALGSEAELGTGRWPSRQVSPQRAAILFQLGKAAPLQGGE